MWRGQKWPKICRDYQWLHSHEPYMTSLVIPALIAGCTSWSTGHAQIINAVWQWKQTNKWVNHSFPGMGSCSHSISGFESMSPWNSAKGSSTWQYRHKTSNYTRNNDRFLNHKTVFLFFLFLLFPQEKWTCSWGAKRVYRLLNQKDRNSVGNWVACVQKESLHSLSCCCCLKATVLFSICHTFFFCSWTNQKKVQSRLKWRKWQPRRLGAATSVDDRPIA